MSDDTARLRHDLEQTASDRDQWRMASQETNRQRIEALERVEYLERRFVRLWELACSCGVIEARDHADWDTLQKIGQQLAEKHGLVRNPR